MNDQLKSTAMLAAAKFREMADRIEHNKDATFAGSAVVFFPVGQQGGINIEPIDILILDSSAGAAQFISTLSTRLSMLMQDIQDKERALKPFGR